MALEHDLGSSPIETGGFSLGDPALVCRWRLSGRGLPLENRHLRALGQRFVGEKPLSPQLVAWAKQHIEWTLRDGSSAYPDGVLMIIVDVEGQAAMTVGPYAPIEHPTLTRLATRAAASRREAEETGVAPETLWAVQDGVFVWGASCNDRASGSASLMLDLAKTCGFVVRRDEELAAKVLSGEFECDEALLVSDEHGILAASDASGSRGTRFVSGYQKLLEKNH